MSETKLIPLDLKALIFNNSLFGSSRRRAFGMAEPTVVPLELAEVRKTQRRVAALLNLPFTGNCICVKRGHQFSSDVCYLCHRFNSHRHLGGDRGKNRKCPHLPPVPQNSFLGLEERIEDSNGLKANFFDTSIFKEGPDPLGFKLPPVFSKDLGKQKEDQQENGVTEPRERRRNRKKQKKPHDRIVPTISEKSFVNSNLRSQNLFEDDDYYDDESYDGDLQFDEEQPDPSYEFSTFQVPLPKIPSGHRNLVSMGKDTDDDVTHRPDDDVYMTSRSEPVMERTMTTGDREKTGASLHIDEDYVPMSVFIKPKSDTDDGEMGVMHQYDDDLSTSISGSLGVSRETSLGESGDSNGDPDNWCRCLDPLTDQLPCQECLHPRGHERWCTRGHEVNTNNDREDNLTCLLCGRPIRPMKTKKRARPVHGKHARSQDRKDSRHRLTPENPAVKSYDQIHDRSTCSGKKQNIAHRKTSRASLDQHVRFDDQVQKVSPDNGKVLPRIALESVKGDPKHSSLFKTRHPIPKPVTSIPNLGVSVHKAAYAMALADSRATGAYKKQGKKNKPRVGSEKPTGTVFSYFPLLKPKRPLSEGEKIVMDLGVKQDEGRKVAPKNYMKHIFGNIKMADYYPGGKKWRQVD